MTREEIVSPGWYWYRDRWGVGCVQFDFRSGYLTSDTGIRLCVVWPGDDSMRGMTPEDFGEEARFEMTACPFKEL